MEGHEAEGFSFTYCVSSLTERVLRTIVFKLSANGYLVLWAEKAK